MSRELFLGTIKFYLLLNYHFLMTDKIFQKNLSTEIQKDFKKSNLDILTDENDRLLKSLKRPSGSYRFA